jgi:predicted nuclease of predicted toxin-antitoxin system
MRLLLDQNLSSRLPNRLSGVYPGLLHVADLGLSRASDREVWAAAFQNDCILVTKDSDFVDLQVLEGFPPKLIWLRLGNCSTIQVEKVLRDHHQDIADFNAAPEVGLLTLG